MDEQFLNTGLLEPFVNITFSREILHPQAKREAKRVPPLP